MPGVSKSIDQFSKAGEKSEGNYIGLGQSGGDWEADY